MAKEADDLYVHVAKAVDDWWAWSGEAALTDLKKRLVKLVREGNRSAHIGVERQSRGRRP